MFTSLFVQSTVSPESWQFRHMAEKKGLLCAVLLLDSLAHLVFFSCINNNIVDVDVSMFMHFDGDMIVMWPCLKMWIVWILAHQNLD